MIAAVTRSLTPKLKLTSQRDTNANGRKEAVSGRIIIYGFSQKAVDRVEGSEALGKGVVRLTGDGDFLVTHFSMDQKLKDKGTQCHRPVVLIL